MLYVKFPVIGQPKKKTVYQLFTTLHETDQLLSIINLNMQRLHTLSMTSILKCSTIGSISSTKYLQQPCSTNYSWNISTHLLSLKLCFPQACLPVYSLRAIIMKSVTIHGLRTIICLLGRVVYYLIYIIQRWAVYLSNLYEP